MGTATYIYTTDNRLATGPGGEYGYDPLDRLFHESAPWSILLYDGPFLAAEIDAATGAVRRRYVHGPGVDEPLVWYEGAGTSDRRWLHADERGSVIAASDGSGNLIGAVNRYDDYGVPQGGTLTGRFGYTGQMWLSEPGIYHYRARDYNPALGRFMQADPIDYEAGMNLYAYVLNDPVNRTDPSGWQDEDPGIVVYGPDPRCDEGMLFDASGRMCANWGSGGPRAFDVGVGTSGGQGSSGASSGRVFRPSTCVTNFGGAALSRAGVRNYDLRRIEFRMGLDEEASEVTIQAYNLPTTGAVTQWDVIYVKHWREFTNPNNAGFWEEIRHSVQFQNTWLFHAQYAASSARAWLSGDGVYSGNRFEREAQQWAAQVADRYRRERPCA